MLFYRSETWTLLAEDSRLVQAFHMTCQSRIFGIRWHDFVTNVDVKRRTKLSNVLQTFARTRHSLFSHNRRLDRNTLAHPPSDSVLTTAAVSGQEAAGGVLPVCLVACGSHSWRRFREYLPGRCAGPRRTGRSGWLDDPATVHENDRSY